MNVIANKDNICIRKMEESRDDFELFLKWMTDPDTMKYWEGMYEHFTYDRVVKGYKEGNEEGIVQCIIEYNSAPIGFCQFCILNAEYYEVPEKEYNRYIEKADLVFGIDIFIGEVSLRNQGLGTKSLRLLITALFNDYHADAILIDPKIHNARAIKCYHKCGFKDYFVVPHRELQDGIYHDSLIMGIRKE